MGLHNQSVGHLHRFDEVGARGQQNMSMSRRRRPERRVSAASDPRISEELRVDIVMAPDGATVFLTGELDLATAPTFEDALAAVYKADVVDLVIDLGGVTFIDSSGLHELVVALKRQRGRGGDVVLRAPSRQTSRVLDIVGLTTLFTIV